MHNKGPNGQVKTCEDALVMLLYFFLTTPPDSYATNCIPLSPIKGILNTTCMLTKSTNIPAGEYAYIEVQKMV